VGVLMTGDVSVLFVNVAVAAFLVASLVLSTFPKPTSPFTIPVGELMTGEVNVLLTNAILLFAVTKFVGVIIADRNAIFIFRF
jgi:hypothetical protein